MVRDSRSLRIAAAPSAVWAVLADFGALSSWARGVADSSVLEPGSGGGLVGTVRQVRAGGLRLRERLIEAVEPTALAYVISGLPVPLRHVANRWTLTADGSGTTVTVTTTIEPRSNPLSRLAAVLVGRAMGSKVDGMLADLARAVESGA